MSSTSSPVTAKAKASKRVRDLDRPKKAPPSPVSEDGWQPDVTAKKTKVKPDKAPAEEAEDAPSATQPALEPEEAPSDDLPPPTQAAGAAAGAPPASAPASPSESRPAAASSSSSSASSSSSSASSSPSSSSPSAAASGAGCSSAGGGAALVRCDTYDGVNGYLAGVCRARTPVDKCFYFEGFEAETFLEVISKDKDKDSSFGFNWKEQKHKYSTFQSPVGVLNFSRIDFDGNRESEKFTPTGPEHVKQSIQWSSRAYASDARDAQDPLQDAAAMRFVRFMQAMHLFAIGGAVDLEKRNECVKKFFKKARETWGFMQSSGAAMTREQLVNTVLKVCSQEPIRKNKYGVFAMNLSTKLLKKPSKYDVTTQKYAHYEPATDYLRRVYEEGGFVYNDEVCVYGLKPLAERRRTPELTPFFELPRTYKIPENSLGAVRFSLDVCTKVGSDKFGLMPYLKAVIVFAPGTPLLEEKLPVLDDGAAATGDSGAPEVADFGVNTFDFSAYRGSALQLRASSSSSSSSSSSYSSDEQVD